MAWWENRFLKIKNGRLFIEGREATQLAEKHGPPLFVYSQRQLLFNFRSLFKLFKESTPMEVRICYAMKANAHPRLMNVLKREGAWIDAVSPGEVEKSRETGFPGKKILFTGTSVSADDLFRVFQQDDVIVTIDASEQLELMKEVKDFAFKHKTIRVVLRWNPGIGRGFSPKTITAGARSSDGIPVKFGIEKKKVIPALVKASEYGFVPVGLHQHLGSGWIAQDYQAVKHAVDRMIQMACEVEQHGFRLDFIDFGGGFGPRYSEKQKIFPIKKYVQYIGRRIAQSGLKLKAVALEPGKYLVGDAGILLLRVEYIKESYGNLFACVNAGTFTSIPRPALYPQAQHPIINCTRINTKKRVKVTVAGNLCETGDVFGQEILMPPPQRGDILAVLMAGAYCRSMASRFNLREIPKEVIV